MKVGIGLPNALPDVSGGDLTERIEARPRGFCGGWTTNEITRPVGDEPGSRGR